MDNDLKLICRKKAQNAQTNRSPGASEKSEQKGTKGTKAEGFFVAFVCFC
jgi:hypothetical protein